MYSRALFFSKRAIPMYADGQGSTGGATRQSEWRDAAIAGRQGRSGILTEIVAKQTCLPDNVDDFIS
jgi:hypothetical protein